MLSLWRRHLKSCPHKAKGRAHTKCACPIWCDGEVDGKRYRQSLETRDWQRAIRKIAAIEDPASGFRRCIVQDCQARADGGRCARHSRTIEAAVAAFHATKQDVAASTKRSYRTSLRHFEEFITSRRITSVDLVDAETINAYRGTRDISARTWAKDLEILRAFFRFCLDADWISRNPAMKVLMPKNIKPADREPYSPEEVIRMIAACDVIGKHPYERLRTRAMILLLRYTALRISDVVTLERSRIRDGKIYLRTAKNGKSVLLMVHPDLQSALNVLPVPRGADGPDCRYFFWSGNGSRRSVVGNAARAMTAVYRASKVPGACNHRFRHTLATEVLEMGGTFEEAADILGDSEAIVRKHYAKWSAGRQARIDDLLARIWHTKKPTQEVLKNQLV